MEKTYYIGLDVGSTTAKIAVIDSDNRVIYSKYERHNARVNELVSQYFDEILALVGDAEARICVTAVSYTHLLPLTRSRGSCSP